jgi:AraC-like DNA-binding protein
MQIRGCGARNQEIAEALGYADAAVLWRAFKGWTGVTPRAFRKAKEEA